MASSLRLYPEGSAAGMLADPIVGVFEHGLRVRMTLAQVNAGAILLPAVSGYKYRLLDMGMISIGGAFTTSTDVRILGTRAGSSVALAVVAVAGLTQSTFVRAGQAALVILADGASFTALDPNTAITIGKTGGTGTVATAVDFFVSYVADLA